MYAGLQQEVSKFGQSTYESCSTFVGSRQQWNSESKRYESKNCLVLANEYNTTAANDDKVNPSECVEYQGACMCKYINRADCKENVVKRNDGYYHEKAFDYKTGSDELDERIDKLTTAMTTDSSGNDKTTLSSATETFNSMQKKVNEEKQKITTLEEKKNSGMQKAISSGAQTLTQAGSALTMTIVNANNNVGTMTGACYIGDPKSGGAILFMNENEVKKLSWKNL